MIFLFKLLLAVSWGSSTSQCLSNVVNSMKTRSWIPATLLATMAYVTYILVFDTHLESGKDSQLVLTSYLSSQRVFTFGKGRSEGHKGMKSLVRILFLSSIQQNPGMPWHWSWKFKARIELKIGNSSHLEHCFGLAWLMFNKISQFQNQVSLVFSMRYYEWLASF